MPIYDKWPPGTKIRGCLTGNEFTVLSQDEWERRSGHPVPSYVLGHGDFVLHDHPDPSINEGINGVSFLELISLPDKEWPPGTKISPDYGDKSRVFEVVSFEDFKEGRDRDGIPVPGPRSYFGDDAVFFRKSCDGPRRYGWDKRDSLRLTGPPWPIGAEIQNKLGEKFTVISWEEFQARQAWDNELDPAFYNDADPIRAVFLRRHDGRGGLEVVWSSAPGEYEAISPAPAPELPDPLPKITAWEYCRDGVFRYGTYGVSPQELKAAYANL